MNKGECLICTKMCKYNEKHEKYIHIKCSKKTNFKCLNCMESLEISINDIDERDDLLCEDCRYRADLLECSICKTYSKNIYMSECLEMSNCDGYVTCLGCYDQYGHKCIKCEKYICYHCEKYNNKKYGENLTYEYHHRKVNDERCTDCRNPELLKDIKEHQFIKSKSKSSKKRGQ